MFDHATYISPFTWRYGSTRMRQIWSERHKYELWRSIWVALARAQHTAGIVTSQELKDLQKHERAIDIDRILELEKETKHDVVAAIGEFAEKARIGGGKIHLGATSMDIVDNADAMRIRESLEATRTALVNLLGLFADKITAYAKVPCMGYTHLQPAEPTTVGYRLAFYAQDLLTDLRLLKFINKMYKGKGMKGAVGTRASYTEIVRGTRLSADGLDTMVMKTLGIEEATVTSQVYPRKFDYLVLSVLSGIASTFAKFAGDLRILQSPAIGEWSEPFGKKQVGSSAMPFKKNPINSEKICSLARYIAALPHVAQGNASLSYLERTLDDSANKRIIVSEAFLALDEMLTTAQKIVEGLVINIDRIEFNLAQYAPFAVTETVLIALVKHGANRQEMHELLRTISMTSWAAVQSGKPNPMADLLMQNTTILHYLSPREISKSLDVAQHIGDAPHRALKLVREIRKTIRPYE